MDETKPNAAYLLPSDLTLKGLFRPLLTCLITIILAFVLVSGHIGILSAFKHEKVWNLVGGGAVLLLELLWLCVTYIAYRFKGTIIRYVYRWCFVLTPLLVAFILYAQQQ